MMGRRVIVLALIGLALPCDGQSADEAPSNPVYSLDELVIQQYRPRNFSERALLSAAKPLVGRHYWVQEKGGMRGEAVENIRALGDTLLLYDTPEYVRRMLDMLVQLDAGENPSDELLDSFEYQPRYVGAKVLLRALNPMERKIAWGRDPRELSSNLNFTETGLLIVREAPEEMRRIRSVIEQVDVPAQEVFVRTYVVRGTRELSGGSIELPVELTKNLEVLLPQYKFEGVGFALLRTSAAPSREGSLRIGGDGPVHYELAFKTVSYDQESGALSLERCEFVRSWMHTGEPRVDSIFRTDANLRSGEYTVLGATGAEPIFLVIHQSPAN